VDLRQVEMVVDTVQQGKDKELLLPEEANEPRFVTINDFIKIFEREKFADRTNKVIIEAVKAKRIQEQKELESIKLVPQPKNDLTSRFSASEPSEIQSISENEKSRGSRNFQSTSSRFIFSVLQSSYGQS
jgi:hypothetical protein